MTSAAAAAAAAVRDVLNVLLDAIDDAAVAAAEHTTVTQVDRCHVIIEMYTRSRLLQSHCNRRATYV